MQETWLVTQKGYDMANRLLEKFASTDLTIEEIALSEGLTADEARVLIVLVEAGGLVVTDFDEPLGEDVD